MEQQQQQKQQLILKSLDGIDFPTDTDTFKWSPTIQKLLLDCKLENGIAILPLPKVHSTILHKILEWIKQHKDTNSEPMNPNEPLSTWDQQFFQVDQYTLFEIMKAAHYLNIESLHSASCMTVAGMMRGKSSAEIRKIFNIPNDFPPGGGGRGPQGAGAGYG